MKGKIIITTALLAAFILTGMFVYPHLYFTSFGKSSQIIIKKDGYPYLEQCYSEGSFLHTFHSYPLLWGNRQPAFHHGTYHIYVKTGKTMKRFDFMEDGSLFLYNPLWQLSIPSSFKEDLQKELAKLDERIACTYGELIPWEEAKKLLPRMGFATVTDFETRLSFRVQRRAGSDHADVQPLTAQDTAVMKKIFNGVWTWDRRAIIVEASGRRIAASMNGRPHGAGAIRNNNFNGHFCIHFFNSTTHSDHLDPDHNRMILRAAGKVP